MKRRWNFLRPLLFLGLCSSLALWMRSCATNDVITWTTAQGGYREIVTIPGQVRFSFARRWYREMRPEWYAGPIRANQIILGHRPIGWSRYTLGLGIVFARRTFYPYRGPGPVAVYYTTLALPLQILAFLFALPLAWPTIRRMRRRRLHRQRTALELCANCGYDLRGSPGACPECGWGVKEKERNLATDAQR